MPSCTCRAEKGGAGVTFYRVKWRRGSPPLGLGRCPKCGAPWPRLACCWEADAPWRQGSLGGQPVLDFEHPSSGSRDAGSHFSAALVPGPLTGQGSVVPRSVQAPRWEAGAPQSPLAPARPWPFSSPEQLLLPRACFFCSFVWCREGIWTLNSRQAGMRFHISLWLWVPWRKGDADVIWKWRLQFHLARAFFITYIICILLQWARKASLHGLA